MCFSVELLSRFLQYAVKNSCGTVAEGRQLRRGFNNTLAAVMSQNMCLGLVDRSG